jgi:hypothetical protein
MESSERVLYHGVVRTCTSAWPLFLHMSHSARKKKINAVALDIESAYRAHPKK